MTIIRSAGSLAVDQVPIESIDHGDTVLTHLPDGSPHTFVVGVKRFDIDKVAGTVTIELQAARETHTHGVGRATSKGRSVRQCDSGELVQAASTPAFTSAHSSAAASGEPSTTWASQPAAKSLRRFRPISAPSRAGRLKDQVAAIQPRRSGVSGASG